MAPSTLMPHHLAPLAAQLSSTTKFPPKTLGTFCGRNGFSIGPALHHYHCFQVFGSSTKALVISDTIKCHHSYLSQPSLSCKDCLLHTINFLSAALANAPTDTINVQLQAINSLCHLSNKLNTSSTSQPPMPPSFQLIFLPPSPLPTAFRY